MMCKDLAVMMMLSSGHAGLLSQSAHSAVPAHTVLLQASIYQDTVARKGK